MKEAIYKKIVYISEKYIKNSFLMGFKNYIRHRGFVVKAYYENNRSVIVTLRARSKCICTRSENDFAMDF